VIAFVGFVNVNWNRSISLMSISAPCRRETVEELVEETVERCCVVLYECHILMFLVFNEYAYHTSKAVPLLFLIYS